MHQLQHDAILWLTLVPQYSPSSALSESECLFRRIENPCNVDLRPYFPFLLSEELLSTSRNISLFALLMYVDLWRYILSLRSNLSSICSASLKGRTATHYGQHQLPSHIHGYFGLVAHPLSGTSDDA